MGYGRSRVLRLCSVKRAAEARSQNWINCIARTGHPKTLWSCLQFKAVFPSWTSRVRPPSPAPIFQEFSGFHLQALYLVYLENPDLQLFLQRFFERCDRLPPAL